MTSAGVKGIGSFMDVAVATKTNIQTSSENFDDTLNSMRVEKKENVVEADNRKNVNEHDDTAKFEATGKKNNVKKEEITDEQIAAVSDEVAGQIKEMLMEKYNITEEELNVVIDEVSLKTDGFMNVYSLTQLVMKLEGVDTQADMLTNPDFAANLKEILAKAEEIIKNVNFEDIQVNAEEVAVTEEVATDANANDDVIADVQENVTDVSETDIETNNTEVITAATTEETLQNNENQNDKSMTGHDDERKDATDVKTADNNMVAPQDFARRLTEDLSQKVGETRANDIVRQVVEQTQLQVKQGVTSLEMQLYPEHLGKVLVQVVTHEGSITAQITAESEAAKNALESQLTLLKENLNNQGVKVENVEVTIASHAFEQNMQGENREGNEQATERRHRRNTGMFFDEVSDEQQDEAEKNMMELKGSTVSYSA